MQFDPSMTKNEHVKQAKDGMEVWADVERYAREGFASIQPDDFGLMRWYGIYQQKPNEGHFMWRIRIAGGRLTPKQLRIISGLSRDYGRGFGDVTTRQDIQLHWMTIEDFPPALSKVRQDAGLEALFACGDTPRNVCACPLAGVIENEVVDIGNLATELSDMYVAAGREFSNLPRKFKTTLSGCPLHCNQPQINDIGAFGVRRTRDGVEERGLGVLVGGGLSSTPHFGQGLRIFVPEAKMREQVPAIWRGVAEIFRDADSLRYKRIRARMKFLVADKGWRWMRDELERRIGFELEHDDSIVNPRGALHTDHVGIGRQKNGLSYVGIPIERGRWTADQMRAVADLTDQYGAPGASDGTVTDQAGQIRLSQKQNVVLINIPPDNVGPLVAALQQVGLNPKAPLWRQNLISCTGAEFCNLAVVETKQRAYEILQHLEEKVDLDSPIMLSISGCPNSCAQYQVADIGLTGTKAQFDGQKVDAYDVCVGGSFGEQPEFVQCVVPKVPSPVIHRVLETLVSNYLQHRVTPENDDPEPFRDFVARNDLQQLQAWSQIPEWTPPPPRKPRAKAATAAAVAGKPELTRVDPEG